jgi:AcrR family transcriptional regulator
MDADVAVLDTAEQLFYAQGVHAVGMDDIRDGSGVSLKRMYRSFATKERLVTEVLRRRDVAWRARLAEYVEAATPDPVGRLLAVFDWLAEWFGEPGFRGCAWINAFGELGAGSAEVVAQARTHKAAVRSYLGSLTTAAGLPSSLADHLALLVEGAMTTAAISGSVTPARQAAAAAAALIRSENPALLDLPTA